MRPASLLALAMLATSGLAAGLGPAAPWDLAAVKAHLEATLPAPEWAWLPEAGVPVATWSLPAGAVGATLDLPTGSLLPARAPAPEGGEEAGCTDYGGAFAVWEPTPPGIYPTCVGDIEHDWPIASITLICAGATPSFGCAHVGVERDRQAYFVFLCGYPEGPLVGIAWPAQGLHLNCALYGEDASTWGRWAATLSANGPVLTHGALSSTG